MAAAINGTDGNDTLTGTDGRDTINGKAGDDVVNALGGDDVINGQEGNDNLNAGAGDDLVNGQQGDDTISGGDGEDILHGQGGNDTIWGDANNDNLFGQGGNDTLTGGDGADTFHYSFAVTQGDSISFSFTDWLKNVQGMGSLVVNDEDNPNAISENDLGLKDGITQNTFVTQYNGWLAYLISQGIGSDVDANGSISEGPGNQNQQASSPTIEGMLGSFSDREDVVLSNNQTRYYSDVYTQAGETTATSEDGHDVIEDFQWGVDKLDFSGVTQEQFLALFVVQQTDVGGDSVMDTVITIDGFSDWGLTLLGVSGHTANDFATDAILFS